MRVHLAQQAQESLGQNALGIVTERGDDVALRIGQRVKMGWPEVLDRPLPRHGTQRGLRWGGPAGMGLASIVPAGDHRTVSVATSLQGLQPTLSDRTAQGREPLDVRDDRLRPLLTHVRQPA